MVFDWNENRSLRIKEKSKQTVGVLAVCTYGYKCKLIQILKSVSPDNAGTFCNLVGLENSFC